MFDGGLKVDVGWPMLNQMLDSGSKVRPWNSFFGSSLMSADGLRCSTLHTSTRAQANWGKFPGASNISAKLSKLKPDGEKGD